MTVQTKIGFGPKVSGEIVVLGKPGQQIFSNQITFDVSGRILLFLCPVSRDLLEKASLVGAVGAVVPSLHYRDFEYFQGAAPDFPLLVLLKFGIVDLPADLENKLEKLSGKSARLDGEGKEVVI